MKIEFWKDGSREWETTDQDICVPRSGDHVVLPGRTEGPHKVGSVVFVYHAEPLAQIDLTEGDF